MARGIPAETGVRPSPLLDVADAYDAHADFVWASLHRLGVAPADLPDLLQ